MSEVLRHLGRGEMPPADRLALTSLLSEAAMLEHSLDTSYLDALHLVSGLHKSSKGLLHSLHDVKT